MLCNQNNVQWLLLLIKINGYIHQTKLTTSPINDSGYAPKI